MITTNRIIIFNLLNTIILQASTLITAPIISRLLGTSNYGIVATYTAWVNLTSTIFSLQSQSTIALAQNKYSEKEQVKYQSSILSLSLLSYLGATIITIFFLPSLSKLLNLKPQALILILMQGMGLFCINFMNIKFTYEFKAKYNFFITIYISVTTLCLSIILIRKCVNIENYWGRLIGMALPYSLAGIYIITYLFSKGHLLFSKEYWTFCLKLCIPIIFHNISNIILSQSDRIMLQNMAGNNVAGIYSLAYSFGAVLTSIWNALNNSWVPFYYKYTRENNNVAIYKHTRNYLELFTAISIVFLFLMKEVFHIFASSDYWDGANLIILFAIGFYFMFLYSFPVNFEFYYAHTKKIAINTMCAAIINILLNIYFIYALGMYGAALATAISYFIQYLFHFLCARKISRVNALSFPFSNRLFIPYLLSFIFGIILVILTDDFVLFRWGIGLIVGIFELFRIYQRKSIF